MVLSEEKTREVINFYLTPYSIRDTAKQFNFDRQTLKRFLVQQGVKLHSKATINKLQQVKKVAFNEEKPDEPATVKYAVTINSILNYFKTVSELDYYWHTHSRREIAPFVQANFNISYFIFRRILLEHFKLKERTKAEINTLNRKHTKETNLKRYGMEHAPNKIYTIDNIYFDSFPELALYLYAKEHNEVIQRCPVKLSYFWNNKEYFYFPDFRYKNDLIEIKGPHFVAPDGSWLNPFDHGEDELIEAKHQCALKNNVKILYKKDYIYFTNWFKNKGYKKENYLVKEA